MFVVSFSGNSDTNNDNFLLNTNYTGPPRFKVYRFSNSLNTEALFD